MSEYGPRSTPRRKKNGDKKIHDHKCLSHIVDTEKSEVSNVKSILLFFIPRVFEPRARGFEDAEEEASGDALGFSGDSFISVNLLSLIDIRTWLCFKRSVGSGGTRFKPARVAKALAWAATSARKPWAGLLLALPVGSSERELKALQELKVLRDARGNAWSGMVKGYLVWFFGSYTCIWEIV